MTGQHVTLRDWVVVLSVGLAIGFASRAIAFRIRGTPLEPPNEATDGPRDRAGETSRQSPNGSSVATVHSRPTPQVESSPTSLSGPLGARPTDDRAAKHDDAEDSAGRMRRIYSSYGRGEDFDRSLAPYLSISSLFSSAEFDRVANISRRSLTSERPGMTMARVASENFEFDDAYGRGAFESFTVSIDGEFVTALGKEATDQWRQPLGRRLSLMHTAHVAAEADVVRSRLRDPTSYAGVRVLKPEDMSLVEETADQLYLAFQAIRARLWLAISGASDAGRADVLRPDQVSAIVIRGGKLTVLRRGDNVDLDNALTRISAERRQARNELNDLLRK